MHGNAAGVDDRPAPVLPETFDIAPALALTRTVYCSTTSATAGRTSARART